MPVIGDLRMIFKVQLYPSNEGQHDATQRNASHRIASHRSGEQRDAQEAHSADLNGWLPWSYVWALHPLLSSWGELWHPEGRPFDLLQHLLASRLTIPCRTRDTDLFLLHQSAMISRLVEGSQSQGPSQAGSANPATTTYASISLQANAWQTEVRAPESTAPRIWSLRILGLRGTVAAIHIDIGRRKLPELCVAAILASFSSDEASCGLNYLPLLWRPPPALPSADLPPAAAPIPNEAAETTGAQAEP
eukprot:scaffold2534_cov260-Pinguiococcus_pyrenoidosus.AAC.12